MKSYAAGVDYETAASSPIAQRVSTMKRARKSLKETLLVSTILCSVVFPRVFLVGVVMIALIHILAN